MPKNQLPQIIQRNQIDGIAAMAVAETESMGKAKGERDTEFVKRIVAAYFNACGAMGFEPIAPERK